MAYRVAFQTFGCKLNQLETESLADAFSRSGALRSAEGRMGEGALLHILNTCTVTGKAEQKARRAIRLALALNPESVVIVTGCYAQVEARSLEALDPRVVVVPGEDKSRLHGLAHFLAEEWQGHGPLLDAVREWAAARDRVEAGVGRFAFKPESFAFHSRPSLKIQDGCDNHCSYCRVCIARGPSESLRASEVVERLRSLESAGAAEVVLTGVNLSHYRSEGLDFPGLLRLLLGSTASVALRLSSYEPDRVDAAFLEVFSEPRVRPHLHLAVQSGSDSVLARMGRRYRAPRILEACVALRKARGDPFLAADFIAGFPGESQEAFEESYELARRADFAWIHAFPFSARPGTAAFSMTPKIPERLAGERVARLGALARQGRRAYIDRWLGRELEAVLEGLGSEGIEEVEVPASATTRRATSENYLHLSVDTRSAPGDAPLSGQAIRCRILRHRDCDDGLDVAAELI